jgi:flagella basal body P-ring formation protein FlgA
LAASNYRLETLARDLAPKGAAAGESPASGARATRDLQAGQIVLAEDIAQLRRIIVVKRDVEIGQSADSTLFETVERNLSEPADSLLSETSNLASFEFSRNIKSGEAVRRADLKPALLIRRGQSVAVTLATNSGLELTFRAEALHDARMGESVTLKNLESGKNIQGIVTGKGSARAL